jgi:hypothetical protein
MQFKPHERAQQIILFNYITINFFIARKAIILALLTKKQRHESHPKVNIEMINIQ